MDAYIVEAMRTPIGRSHKDKGIFKDVRADKLLETLFNYFKQNVISPAEEFSVAQYRQLALRAIEDILKIQLMG